MTQALQPHPVYNIQKVGGLAELFGAPAAQGALASYHPQYHLVSSLVESPSLSQRLHVPCLLPLPH